VNFQADPLIFAYNNTQMLNIFTSRCKKVLEEHYPTMMCVSLVDKHWITYCDEKKGWINIDYSDVKENILSKDKVLKRIVRSHIISEKIVKWRLCAIAHDPTFSKCSDPGSGESSSEIDDSEKWVANSDVSKDNIQMDMSCGWGSMSSDCEIFRLDSEVSSSQA